MPPDTGARGPALRATYRIQLHRGFSFEDAAEIVPYLAELGISHVYCSPYFQAERGSGHGYNFVDPHTIDGDRGGMLAHARFCTVLRRHGLGHIVDTVPNHMSVASIDNRWWEDVLADGQDSPYAGYFDIDWDSRQSWLTGKVLVPFLERPLDEVIEDGELHINSEQGAIRLRCGNLALPLNVAVTAEVVRRAIQHPGGAALAPVLGMLDDLPAAGESRATKLGRWRARRAAFAELAMLSAASRNSRAALAETIHGLNTVPSLREICATQHYVLCYWRTAMEDINYRRFFDVNDLAAVRVEDEDVFDDTHALLAHLIASGVVDGLRVDHLDGLRDPGDYLRRLREKVGDAWLIVEKIGTRTDPLPDDWPIDGSSGYDFLRECNGLFVDPNGLQECRHLLASFVGSSDDTEDTAGIVTSARRTALTTILPAYARHLTDIFQRLVPDVDQGPARAAITELLVHFPAGRTMIAEAGRPSARDAAAIAEGHRLACADRPDLTPILGTLRDLLLRRGGPGDAALRRDFAMRFQQYTPALDGKGNEDTAMYRHLAVTSLNERSVSMDEPLTCLEDFHERMVVSGRRYPRGMLTTSTHDTLRAEDVRARIAVLAEIPGRWFTAVQNWAARNERYKVDGLPDPAMEYLFYQTLVGAHQLPLGRALFYMDKASREAKVHTSSVYPNPVYDRALVDFVTATLGDAEFLAGVDAFAAEITQWGRQNSLSQTLLKLTAPGIPDVYQGSEVWDLSLVDPDNRRPVQHARNAELLRRVRTMSGPGALAEASSGAPKLLVHWRALDVRSRHPGIFDGNGAYQALYASGDNHDAVVSFVRGEPPQAVTIAPRFPATVNGLWGNTELTLPDGEWRDVFTGTTHHGGAQPLNRLVGSFPVALLTRL